MVEYSEIKAAYDNSPIGLVFLEPIYENETLVDLAVQYANPLAASYWGLQQDEMTGFRFAPQGKSNGKEWLDMFQRIQVTHEKRSIYHPISTTGVVFRFDCFYFDEKIMGCFVRKAGYEMGKQFHVEAPNESRSLSEKEQDIGTLIENFASSGLEFLEDEYQADYICISDAKTDEIITLLAAKTGPFSSLISDGYKGKTCSEALFGETEGCGPYHEQELQVNRYTVWRHHDEKLNKDYIHRVKLAKYEGSYVRVDIAQDVSDPNRSSRLLEETLCSMSLWAECISELSDQDSIIDGLDLIIGKACTFFGASSGGVILFGKEEKESSWSIDGPYAISSVFHDPSQQALELWGGSMKGTSYVYVPETNAEGVPTPLREVFKEKSIASFYLTPIFIKGKLRGVFVINNASRRKSQTFIIDMIATAISYRYSLLEAEKYANEIRYTDSLTGYLNLEGFKNVAEETLRGKAGTRYVLWHSDIRRFKYVNDMLGYEMGDSFLRFWTDGINASLKDGELFGRVSADNIVALMYYESDEALQEAFDAMDRSLKGYPGLQEKDFRPELVSGAYVLDDEDMRDPNSSAMMDKANIAQKSVKMLTGSRMAIYDHSMREKQLRELEISQHLEEGLRKKEFYIVLQPQYNYATNEVVSAEALVRWNHPELGAISPGEFIPLLEKAGLITELDKFVWEEACKFVRRMLDDSKCLQAVPISVNISRIDIYMPNLGAYISDLVKKYDLEPHHVKLEITESAYIADSEQLIEVVAELRERGFSVEMDDFGSGYSSLNILKDVPVDVLKLDMRFLAVEATTDDERGGSILSSIIRMAYWIGLPVIAEGVETLEQANYLESLGCYVMQGFYFARPMPVDQFLSLLEDSKQGSFDFHRASGDVLGAAEFLSTNGATSYLFNNCIGGGCLLEFDEGNFEALLINDAFFESMGLPRSVVDARRTHMLSLFVEEDRAEMINALTEAVEKGSSTVYARTIRETGALPRWVRGTNHYLASQENRHMIFAVVEDVTEQRRSEIRLHEVEQELNALTDDSVERWRAVQHYVMTGVGKAILFDYDVEADSMLYCVSDKDGTVEETRLEGFISENKFESIYLEDRDRFTSLLNRVIKEPTSATFEFRSQYFTDHFAWSRAHYVSLTNERGEVNRVIGRIDDIDEEKKLQQQANRDSLTGFYNQAATKSTIGSMLEEKQQGTLFVIDVDDFKNINDTLGHLFGDSFLREVSALLRKAFRDEDILGRIGGDEFVVFVPEDLRLSVVKRKADSILEVFRSIKIPQLGSVHASVGVAMLEDDIYHDYAALFKKADYALYRAKHKGKDQYLIYEQEDTGSPIPTMLASYNANKSVVASSDSESEALWPHTLAGDVFSILYNADRTYEGINRALAHVGEWLNVSRVYIFEVRNNLLYNTYEWCNDGISGEIDNLQDIPIADEDGSGHYEENFDIDGIFYLRYAEDAPQWQREILEPQGIKSMLQHIIKRDGEMFGFIGFDECKENVFWTKEQIDVLVRIAQMVSVFLVPLIDDQRD